MQGVATSKGIQCKSWAKVNIKLNSKIGQARSTITPIKPGKLQAANGNFKQLIEKGAQEGTEGRKAGI